MTQAITTVRLHSEQDVVLARQRARQVASLLGFDRQDQARIATAISELARNAFEYADGGRVEYTLSPEHGGSLVIRITDGGPGIAELDAILGGRFKSRTGMGVGIPGARRLMDELSIDSSAQGTSVTAVKRLRGPLPSSSDVALIAEKLRLDPGDGAIGELQRQNQELVGTLDELAARQQELARLNRELEETNRGVVALYAELDQRAEELRGASEAKSRFLSSVSHELRTPVSSTLALTELLLSHADGPLTEEQTRQVNYIRTGAETLLSLVDELLDLARIEAGKMAVQAAWFEVDDLLSTLRGMFRPLHRSEHVSFVIEAPPAGARMYGDRRKVAQILRNLVSNALKFTEQGEVRVRTQVDEERGVMRFQVTDTGIGIDRSDHARIFDEFEQVAGRLQESVRGTGLGLAVSRRLAHLLGGDLTVDSELGHGATFALSVPVVHTGDGGAEAQPDDGITAGEMAATRATAGRQVALVIDDDEAERYVSVRALRGLGLEVAEASDGESGLIAAREQRPDVIVLDLRMPGIDGFAVLRKLNETPATAGIPVVINTARPVTLPERARLTAAAAIIAKRERNPAGLEATVAGLLRAPGG